MLSFKYDLGNVYKNLYDLDKAKECYEEALKYSKLTRHFVYGNIGYIHFLKYELEQALEFYQNSLEICEQIKEKRVCPFILYNLIVISIELQNIVQAKQYLEQLKQFSEETGFDWIIKQYRFASILALKTSGDFRNLSQAVELFDKVFSLLDKVGSTFLLFLLHYVIYCDTLALFIIVNVIKACYSFVK